MNYPYKNDQSFAYGRAGLRGGKASSKGFKGACFKCGQVGHRAVDCQSKSANAVDEFWDEDEEVALGGVWMIAAVNQVSKPKRSITI